MQIAPVPPDQLPEVLGRIWAGLAGDAARAFARITQAPLRQLAMPDHAANRGKAARRLARSFGIPVIEEAPARAFSWDGVAIRVASEPSVVLHEIAHWQLCPAERLALPDFGLGAGPETGRKAEADAARTADPATELLEEQRASLLGILWEARLGQPALKAFLEQNWLEGWTRGAAARHFAGVLRDLAELGLATPDGTPLARSIRT